MVDEKKILELALETLTRRREGVEAEIKALSGELRIAMGGMVKAGAKRRAPVRWTAAKRRALSIAMRESWARRRGGRAA